MQFSDHDNIVLIGMPGVGKSTLGVVLAKILNMSFIDTDLLIQERCGSALQDIIDERGTAGFVDIENDVLKSVNVGRTIISTGGSAVYSHEAMEHLSSMGKIVYLRSSTEDLSKHLGSFDDRGVVSLKDDVLDLKSLHDERAPLYERYADLVVDTSGLEIREAIEAALSSLKELSIVNSSSEVCDGVS